MDSLSALRPGRRALPFVGGEVGAPDSLIAWAKRQDCSVRVALGDPRGFCVEELDGSAPVEASSERCVSLLSAAVEAHPASWAWVNALALLALALSTLFLGPVGCAEPELLPPVPRAAEDWRGEAQGLTWTGEVPGQMRARLRAESATGIWRGNQPLGNFEGLELELWSSETGVLLARVDAESAEGTWPGGPLDLRLVDWQIPSRGDSGQVDSLRWTDSQGWSCSGCPLEGVGP